VRDSLRWRRGLLACPLSVIILLATGCATRSTAPPSSSTDSSAASTARPEETVPALPAVSESDIASASAVVRAHVEAFARGDASAWRATLGRYKAGGWDATQFERTVVAWRDVRLESLELSGLYTTDSPPSSYVSNYGAPPFATIVLHARFERPDNAPEMAPYDWDYILVRETPDGPWRIHDWGG
jgi:hypothetical protein